MAQLATANSLTGHKLVGRLNDQGDNEGDRAKDAGNCKERAATAAFVAGNHDGGDRAGQPEKEQKQAIRPPLVRQAALHGARPQPARSAG